MRHSHAAVASTTTMATATRMAPQAFAGTGRSGTGCAMPGRSAAVSRSALVIRSGCAMRSERAPSELEVDERIAGALLDDDGEQHDGPDARDERCGSLS